MESLVNKYIRHARRKVSRFLPLIISILVHGSILLFLIYYPYSKLLPDSVDYYVLNTDLIQYAGDISSDVSSSQRQEPENEEHKNVTHDASSVSDEGVSSSDDIDAENPGETDSSGTESGTDTLNYIDFNSGSIGGGNMKLPTFMGGDFNSFRNWFMKRFRLPVDAPVNYKERVIVAFSVDRTGAMRNIRVRSCSSAEVEKEILRVLNNAPAWEPGFFNGDYTGFNFQMPVSFKGN